MLKKIYQELVEIRKELQAIRGNQELKPDKTHAETKALLGMPKADLTHRKETRSACVTEEAFNKLLRDLKEIEDKCDYAYGFAQGFTNRTGYAKHP